MSSPVGLLDFYVLEASEYIDRLDTLVAGARGGIPEPAEFVGTARALRGSSLMARAHRIAELAGAVEQVGRAARDGAIRWAPEVAGAVTAAIDDLRVVLRSVRRWGEDEERRSNLRIAELRALLPEDARRGAGVARSAPSTAYLGGEAEAIAGALERYLADSTDRGSLQAALERVRAVRGIAALKDFPPLGDVADAIERAARVDATGTPADRAPQLSLFDAAARVLRRAATDLHRDSAPDANAPEVRRFVEAAAALDATSAVDDRIVPISALFYGDAGPHVVHRSQRPPSTAERRFRTEIVSHAEHLRRLIADTRAAVDVAGRERATRELRAGVRAVRSVAESFGAMEVARFFRDSGDGVALDPLTLAALDAAASLLSSPTIPSPELVRQLGQLARGRIVDGAIGAGLEPIDRTRAGATTPVRAPAVTPPRPARRTPARRHPATPTGSELRDFLQHGIAGFRDLDTRPLSEPAALDEESVVPIDSLLYRGDSAIARAIALREELRARGEPRDETLGELFDMLDLATAE